MLRISARGRTEDSDCNRDSAVDQQDALLAERHCEHCDAKQGDHFVQGPDGPFWPYDEAQMKGIEATRLEGPFRLPDAARRTPAQWLTA